jgi:hypothetical protein
MTITMHLNGHTYYLDRHGQHMGALCNGCSSILLFYSHSVRRGFTQQRFAMSEGLRRAGRKAIKKSKKKAGPIESQPGASYIDAGARAVDRRRRCVCAAHVQLSILIALRIGCESLSLPPCRPSKDHSLSLPLTAHIASVSPSPPHRMQLGC